MERFERGRQFEASGTADGHSFGRAFYEIFKLGLFPGASAFSKGVTYLTNQ